MDTKQTPESKTLSTKKITSSAWKRFLDRIRRRIAFVPYVDDTVKSLKDVGIELKDNQPWTLSPSILHRWSQFSCERKYHQSFRNAGLQWLAAERKDNEHASIMKVPAPPSAHSLIGNQKHLQLIESQMIAKQVIYNQENLSPMEKYEHYNSLAYINYINALKNLDFSPSEPLSLRSYYWSYW